MVACAVLGLSRVTGNLPADLTSLSAWRSPLESTVLGADGIERARFRLVDASSWPIGDHEELVEAFLAASPSAFYEPRSLAATSLGPALRRLLVGSAPPASPLSVELSRLLLAAEAPGPARRLREDLVSTWLDAEVPLPRRVVAWIDRVPLCLGRRGLERASTVCLGTGLADLDLGGRVTLAAAAAWGLDLAGDRDVIEARRGLVFDALVVQGRLQGLEAARHAASGVIVPRPSGPSAWAELVGLGPRHLLGRSNDPRPAAVHTSLRWTLQEALVQALPGDSGFVVLQPADGTVLALGGDMLAPQGADGGPSPLDLAAWAGAVVRAASLSGELPDAVQPVVPRWIERVTVGPEQDTYASDAAAGGALGSLGRHPMLTAPPKELLGVDSLSELPLHGGMRFTQVYGATLALHEGLVAVWFGGELPVGEVFAELAGGVAFSRPERFSWTP